MEEMGWLSRPRIGEERGRVVGLRVLVVRLRGCENAEIQGCKGAKEVRRNGEWGICNTSIKVRGNEDRSAYSRVMKVTGGYL